MTAAADVVVDVFADFTCPWCYVGWRSLQAAAAGRTDITLRPIWRPFLLNPATPPEGYDRRAYFAERAAADPDRWAATRAALEAAAAQAGAPLDLNAPTRIPSTIDAHRLMIWAGGQGRTAEAAEALFAAYWVRGEDLSDAKVLISVAVAAGLEGEIVAELLASGADRDAVAALHEGAVRLGVTGVPVMTFNRREVVMGAEAPAVYAGALDAALA